MIQKLKPTPRAEAIGANAAARRSAGGRERKYQSTAPPMSAIPGAA